MLTLIIQMLSLMLLIAASDVLINSFNSFTHNSNQYSDAYSDDYNNNSRCIN